MNRLRRKTGKASKLFGVCAGLGDFFDIDPTLIRIFWAIATVLGLGSPILIYIICVVVIPKESI